jgi:hypothetical protein
LNALIYVAVIKRFDATRAAVRVRLKGNVQLLPVATTNHLPIRFVGGGGGQTAAAATAATIAPLGPHGAENKIKIKIKKKNASAGRVGAYQQAGAPLITQELLLGRICVLLL